MGDPCGCPVTTSKYELKKLLLRYILVFSTIGLGSVLFSFIEECQTEEYASFVENDSYFSTPDGKNLCEFLQEVNESKSFNSTNQNWFDLPKYLHECSETKIEISTSVEECNFYEIKYFGKWCLFCFVTVFTIGYGDTVPQTGVGKMVTVVYAFIGIPLTMLLLSAISTNLLAAKFRLFKFFQLKVLRYKRLTYVYRNVFLMSITLVIIMLALAVVINSRIKDLDLVTNLYFTFITISTIGYGDIYLDSTKPNLEEFLLKFLLVQCLLVLLSCIGCIFTLISVFIEGGCFICQKYVLDDDNSQEIVEVKEHRFESKYTSD